MSQGRSLSLSLTLNLELVLICSPLCVWLFSPLSCLSRDLSSVCSCLSYAPQLIEDGYFDSFHFLQTSVLVGSSPAVSHSFSSSLGGPAQRVILQLFSASFNFTVHWDAYLFFSPPFSRCSGQSLDKPQVFFSQSEVLYWQQ